MDHSFVLHLYVVLMTLLFSGIRWLGAARWATPATFRVVGSPVGRCIHREHWQKTSLPTTDPHRSTLQGNAHFGTKFDNFCSLRMRMHTPTLSFCKIAFSSLASLKNIVPITWLQREGRPATHTQFESLCIQRDLLHSYVPTIPNLREKYCFT